MLIVHVHVTVKPEFVAAFEAATVANAKESLKEPGVARFDLLKQSDNPTQFIIMEAYRDEQAPARHRETKHYLTWRDAVAPMMAEPRVRVTFSNVYPPAAQW
jgi:quinol monooxygenase YgiN